jgi:hypothetical protein
MATRSEKITITKPASVPRSEAESAGEVADKRPRNMPRAGLVTEGFALVVDGKEKSHFDSAAAATEAGLELKRAFPVLQVGVRDAVGKSTTRIDLPEAGSAGPAKS